MKRIWKPITLLAVVGVVAGGALLVSSPASADGPVVTVYKSPTCGCCTKWVDHLRDNGFTVETVDRTDIGNVKKEHGVPGPLASCHTAVVDGYIVEGHVPADVIHRLLEERPAAAGLAVPDMPVGSPGMEGPYREPYDIFLFDGNGHAEIYESR